MRFTIRLRIMAALGLALLLALLVGAVGLYGMHRTYAMVEEMYQGDVMAIVEVSAARAAIVDERQALNRALLDPSRRDTVIQVRRDSERLAAAWKRYDPALVAPGEERALATQFVTLMAATEPEVMKEALWLDAGKTEQARSLHLSKVADAQSRATAIIDRLRIINAQQAADSAQIAGIRFHRTWMLMLALWALALLSLMMAAWALIRAIVRPLEQARVLAQAIEQGRLDNAVLIGGNHELSDTLHSLKAMDRQLAGIVAQVRDVAEQVSSASHDLSQGNDELAQRAQEQASSLEQTAAAMEELSDAVNQNAQSSLQARQKAAHMRQRAEQGSEVAAGAVDAMQAITQVSREVGEIVAMIDAIAFQTNLLALNAAVEAARAGEQGRGFAVVAGEVRVLAQRSGAAAKQIRSLIQHSSEKVAEGASLVQRTGDALKHMAGEACEVSAIIDVIAAASEQQAAGVGQVNLAVISLDEVTRRNAALAERASAVSRHTLELSQALVNRVAYFSVQSD